MKILFVVSKAIELNTSASIRNRATIRGLIENGHEVDIITGKPDVGNSNYSPLPLSIQNVDIEYLNLGLEEKSFNLLRIVASNAKKYIPNTVEKFLYNILAFYNNANIYDNTKGIVKFADDIKIKDGDYDLIISSSDPKTSHLFVSKLFEKNSLLNTPWLQIWGDPWYSDIGRKNSNQLKAIYSEEKRLLNLATKVMYVSLFTLNSQKFSFKDVAHKMFWQPVPYEKEIRYENKLENSKLTFLYAGDYNSNIRDIMPLYNSFIGSKHQLIICGGSNVKLDEHQNIKVYPRLSQDKIDEFTKQADVLVNLSNLKGSQIPGKLYHYSGTNKPILFILDGDSEKIYNLYKSFNRYTFTNNIKENISKSVENFLKLNKNLNNSPIKEFHYKYVTKKIIESMLE